MTQGSNELHFFYDAQNKPAVVAFNGTPYSYVKNLQGDIVAILDSNGIAVVQYKYDAWGRPINCTYSDAHEHSESLGKLNPFRYRGYVYDEETGLYYLRSRYYNPTYCRFINADVLHKGNLYAYCANDPNVFCDRDGYDIMYCLDDNGLPVSFMNHFMFGGSGGGGSGHTIMMSVSNMDDEERKDAALTVAVVGVSMIGSAGVMYGSHLLGKGFLAEATLVNSFSNRIIGYSLYGATIANGIGLSYAWDDAVHSLFRKDTEPRTEKEFVRDFVMEFIPIDVPVPLEFINTYMQEMIE